MCKPNDAHLVVGTADGTLTVRQRTLTSKEVGTRTQNREILASGAYEYMIAGASQNIRIHNVSDQDGPSAATSSVKEVKVKSSKRKRLKEWDRLLKAFRYSDALDSVVQRQDLEPQVIVALLLELIHRNGLRIALSGRDDVGLEPILKFLLKHISDPRYGLTICDVMATLLSRSHDWSSLLKFYD